MRWNLGCSDRLLPGYVNIDIAPPCDHMADLTQRWPAEDSTVDEIVAHDIIEHLPDKIHTMNEAWRVLKPSGIFDIIVPSTRGAGAWCDPQHCSYWNSQSFEYFEEGGAGRKRFGLSYDINARFWITYLTQSKDINRYGDEIWKINVMLKAVK